MEIIKLNQKAVKRAVKIIKKGGVIICPTDTVYGFLADASNKKAIEKIFKLKKRSRSKPLPVFVRDFKMAKKLAKINEKQEKILTQPLPVRLRANGVGARKIWPGNVTIVLKRKPGIKIYGVDKKTIALRIPKYKFLNNLLKKINKPLVQTSVNISGQPPLTKIGDIISQFGMSDIPMLIIDAGNLPKRKPSKIVDLVRKCLTRLR